MSSRYEFMHVFVRSTLAGRAALADGWIQDFDQGYHLDVRLWMPADATVAKDWVASCDPSTAEALPCSASRAADVTSTIWSRSWPAAAVSCSGMMYEHPQVLATLTLTLLRRSLDFCRVRRPFELRQSKLVDGFSSRPRFSDWSWRSTIFTVEVRA